MKDKILKGWNFNRAIFLLIGAIIFIDGIFTREWIALLIGAIFTFMAIFAIGCASGSCSTTKSCCADAKDSSPMID